MTKTTEALLAGDTVVLYDGTNNYVPRTVTITGGPVLTLPGFYRVETNEGRMSGSAWDRWEMAR